MESVLNSFLYIGPIVFGSGLLYSFVCGALYSCRPNRKAGRSLLSFIGRSMAIGFGAFIVGAGAGIAAFCSSADAGNLCGLGGVFGTGPFLSGICVGGYAYRWLKTHREAA